MDWVEHSPPHHRQSTPKSKQKDANQQEKGNQPITQVVMECLNRGLANHGKHPLDDNSSASPNSPKLLIPHYGGNEYSHDPGQPNNALLPRNISPKPLDGARVFLINTGMVPIHFESTNISDPSYITNNCSADES
ncbi:hypothetical protein RND71_035467 [Anisodus tanguticus]|uniref:Uncharacterized protein n=1 Tax=Anisodus tanguticus TaxID=243964 RepID=A0AAE1R5L4_9SOLA|nr:hypothetical protein RND71_035467 [Anisodus tanguticus]